MEATRPTLKPSVSSVDEERAVKEEKVPVTYQGRKTSRAGSELRRKAILEAALRIVVRDGVRGVRHRAVAKEADVPLSATTYYFKDISDLITDTFTLFAEVGTEKYRNFWGESKEQLINALLELKADPASKERVMTSVVEVIVHYLRNQLLNHRDYLLAEQAFRLESLRNDNLKQIAEKHTGLFLKDLTELFVVIGSESPEADATLLMQLIYSAEYEGLLRPEGEFDEVWARKLFMRGLQLFIGTLFASK
ncbi:TetR/AcrR family transcriptional regulator [Parendozoicomonas haliclonae]|uniref:HTH-type transcriptional regulator BetI n=1 Tax=Parendozoicomonas haliclonae TaxID=1960125 RepID=A0A1X7AQA9_9GAMM|nr:TetR family transcriptional regulator [Parendozoicomonas haliclonae]SMA50435.1 HTH-type transcriptional regulator BetI [Parendozoicomonas haliclonae]